MSNTKKQNERDYKSILDGSIIIDFNSDKALEFKEKCEDINNHSSDVVLEVYGSFEELYKSGDIYIDFAKVFARQTKERKRLT